MVGQQTPEYLVRECLGTITRSATRVMEDAMDMDIPSLKVHFNFLKEQVNRLELLEKNILVKKRVI